MNENISRIVNKLSLELPKLPFLLHIITLVNAYNYEILGVVGSIAARLNETMQKFGTTAPSNVILEGSWGFYYSVNYEIGNRKPGIVLVQKERK